MDKDIAKKAKKEDAKAEKEAARVAVRTSENTVCRLESTFRLSKS